MRISLVATCVWAALCVAPALARAQDPEPEIPSAARRAPGVAPAPDGPIAGEPSNMPLPGDRPAAQLPGGAGNTKMPIPSAQLPGGTAPLNAPGPAPGAAPGIAPIKPSGL